MESLGATNGPRARRLRCDIVRSGTQRAVYRHRGAPVISFRARPAAATVERSAYIWLAVVLELFTALGAIPVGIQLLMDTTGALVGFPPGWIEATPFGSYLVPGIYLLLVNGVGMLILAALTVRRHWTAPWLTGILGIGLMIWIGVQLVVMPETSFLQAMFGGIGIVLAVIGVAWLRRTGQLRLW
jgi:hypothetical protein